MFQYKYCSVEECRNLRLTDSDVCWIHLQSKEAYREKMISTISSMETVKDLNLSLMDFDNVDFSGKHFYTCKFSNTVFHNSNFEGSLFRLCFFDFSSFFSCKFSGIDMQSCVFTGSIIENGDFTESDIFYTNFNGIRGKKLSFKDSDLYFSYFINAYLEDILFIECNLKKVNLAKAEINNLSFKYSNYEEAEFDEKYCLGEK